MIDRTGLAEFLSDRRQALQPEDVGLPRGQHRRTDGLRRKEFQRGWDDQEIGIRPHEVKHFVHPEVGALELNCQRLVDPGQAHHLRVYTALPGTEGYEKLQVLSVIGAQTLR
ncbi:hypothetical protein ACFWTE_04930 [Nocardiopsis sp. NPDC058631]|uniref:MmyB family transcriptional regulator n=1 Tax=Nocardiopsis sp. NPDC058631 TaxID=3346566 RepID=UPI0036601A44